MVQAITPDDYRGRVSSVEYIIGSGGGPLGNVESGTVAALTTPVISAVSGGLACLILAGVTGLACPAFARFRAGEHTLAAGGVMDVKVVDNPDMGRFEILADGEVAGFALYQLYGSQIVFTHTETDDRFQGQGLGSRLVRASLDAARERHLTVLPYCPFTRNWMSTHREYADLVPEDRRAQFGL